MGATQAVARWVCRLRYDDLPPQAVAVAKRALLDTVGVILAGVDEPSARAVRAMLAEDGARPAATVLGTGLRTSISGAAMANATSGHALDYDDISLTVMGHPSVVMAPTVLAVAEATGASGRALLTGFAAGVELMAKLGKVMGVAHYLAGWHLTMTLGTLGAAAAAGKVMGLSREQMASALGIAVSLAGGSRRNFGSLTKAFHPGHAARCGIEAARLARHGLTADAAAIEGENGFFWLFSPGQGDPQALAGHLGNPFDLADPGLGIKLYPCCYQTHRAVDAALALRAAVVPADLAQVEVTVPAGGLAALISRPPRTGLEAKFSMEYVVASSLLDGRPTLATFTDPAVGRPAIQALLPLIRVAEDPDIPYQNDPVSEGWVEVRVTGRDGAVAVRRVAYASGSPRAPLDRGGLLAKFRDCAGALLDAARMTRVVHLLENLETCPDCTELTALLGEPQG